MAFRDVAASARPGLAELRRLGVSARVAFRISSPIDAWVRVDPASMEAEVLRVLRLAYPKIAHAFERHLVPWARVVADAWPVKTGESRSGLRLVVEVSERDAVGRLVSAATYTQMIRRKGERTRVWDEAAEGLDEVGRRVGEAIQGGPIER
jgi:hypothetical protein